MTERYRIAEGDSAHSLAAEVNALIDTGWRVAGGVAVSVSAVQVANERKGYTETKTMVTYAQAMISREIARS